MVYSLRLLGTIVGRMLDMGSSYVGSGNGSKMRINLKPNNLLGAVVYSPCFSKTSHHALVDLCVTLADLYITTADPI